VTVHFIEDKSEMVKFIVENDTKKGVITHRSTYKITHHVESVLFILFTYVESVLLNDTIIVFFNVYIYKFLLNGRQSLSHSNIVNRKHKYGLP
jgi:hypothetical protein